MGRPSKKQQLSSQQKYRLRKKSAQRNHVEGKFGHGKRGYGLNNIKARLYETLESWVNSIFFVMNLEKLLKLIDKYGNIFVDFYIRMILHIENRISPQKNIFPLAVQKF